MGIDSKRACLYVKCYVYNVYGVHVLVSLQARAHLNVHAHMSPNILHLLVCVEQCNVTMNLPHV